MTVFYRKENVFSLDMLLSDRFLFTETPSVSVMSVDYEKVVFHEKSSLSDYFFFQDIFCRFIFFRLQFVDVVGNDWLLLYQLITPSFFLFLTVTFSNISLSSRKINVSNSFFANKKEKDEETNSSRCIFFPTFILRRHSSFLLTRGGKLPLLRYRITEKLPLAE